MNPPYCAFGSADCFYTDQSPNVLNPKSTIRIGESGCCRRVVAGFPRGKATCIGENDGAAQATTPCKKNATVVVAPAGRVAMERARIARETWLLAVPIVASQWWLCEPCAPRVVAAERGALPPIWLTVRPRAAARLAASSTTFAKPAPTASNAATSPVATAPPVKAFEISGAAVTAVVTGCVHIVLFAIQDGSGQRGQEVLCACLELRREHALDQKGWFHGDHHLLRPLSELVVRWHALHC